MKWINRLFDSYINRLIILYFMIGFIWTVNTDYLLLIFIENEQMITIMQMSKTVFFLIVTSILLFYLLKRYDNRLRRTISKLRASNHDLRLFFYKISHDLRGPLVSSIGLTDIARDEVTDPVAKEYFMKIRQSASKLDQSLTNLMELSSIIEGDLKVVNFDLQDMINGVMKDFEHFPNAKEIKVEKDYDDVKEVHTDKNLVLAVIQNLIENAIKYMDTTKDQPFIHIRLTKQKGGTVLTIQDNGIGISDMARPHIFQIFYRGTNLSQGSGMGLYIVKMAVERLQGTIEIDSEEYQYTKVEVFFPNLKNNVKAPKEEAILMPGSD